MQHICGMLFFRIIGSLLLIFSIKVAYSATEVVGIPSKSYQMIGEGSLFESFDEMVADTNAARASDYDLCLTNSPPYSCTKLTITEIKPGTPYRLVNGELQFVMFPRDSLTTSQATPYSPINNVYRTNVGSLGGYFSLKCESGHLAGKLIAEDEYHYDCVRYVDFYLKTKPKRNYSPPSISG